jgi:hypothetical protein
VGRLIASDANRWVKILININTIRGPNVNLVPKIQRKT